MLLLASTSDELRITTSQAANIDVQTSWADLVSSVVTVGRTNTLITTATTTTVVASPGASTYRTIKSVIVRNRSALTPSRVTVTHRASGPTDVELISVLLMPNDSIVYTEHDTFRYVRNPYGTLSASHDTVWLTPSVASVYTVVLPRDITNNNATANRLVDVPDLRFPVREGQRYWFNFFLMYTAAAITTGARFSIYGPGSPTALRYQEENSLTTTTKTNTEGHAVYDLPAASSATSAATGSNIAQIEGFVDVPTCDGYVYLRFASEIAASAIILKAGSRLEWQRMT